MSYKVTIENTDHSFVVNEGESVLDAALRSGLVLPYSCRGGTCGSCAGKVVEGKIEYPYGEPEALSEAEAAVGQALFCQARPKTDLRIEVREVRSASDIIPRKLPCRVMVNEPLCHDVRRLMLKTPGNERLQFLAGQYIDILLKDGRRRAFSLANAPHDDELLELHVRLVEGGEFTKFVFDNMGEGSLLRFEGPLGHFYLREESDRPILMMGGGTGFAPLKGMIEHAFHIGLDRPIHLFWGARAKRDLYMDDLPRRWAEEHAHFQYTPVLSEPAEGEQWEGATGWVHETLLDLYPNVKDFDVYMSGPPAMVTVARDAFLGAGLPENRLFSDAFEFSADSQPGKDK